MSRKDEIFLDDVVWGRALRKMETKSCDKLVLQFLSNKEVREDFKKKVLCGDYVIKSPKVVAIPKDDGGTRELYCYQGADRVLLAVINEIYYELFNDKVHENVMSYKKGSSTGKVVKVLARQLGANYHGYKCDVSKYFDSVSRDKVNGMLQCLEDSTRGAIDDLVFRLYNDDRVIVNGDVVNRYKSLGQGCALSALFSNIMLYDFDVSMTKYSAVYYRYSDDFVVVGDDSVIDKAQNLLADYGLKLKPEKVQEISDRQWFNFLGYAIRQGKISYSKKFVKEFRHKIKVLTTTKNREEKRALTEKEVKRTIKKINRWLYGGKYSKMGKYFATVTGAHDTILLDKFVKDSLRSMMTNKCDTGGIGWDEDGKEGTIHRGKGKNVTANRAKDAQLQELGYISMVHMQKLYKISPDVYKVQARSIR